MKKRRGGRARIADAAEWRLLGLLFERPRAAWHEEVAALAREVRDAEVRAAAAAAHDAIEGDYLSLLGPGGAVSPREVTYCSFADPGRVLADVAAFYDAFGFHPRAEDPIDHVAVETGFVGYLLLKEAFARAHEDRTAAEATAAARNRFLEDHLAALAGALAERLAACGRGYVASAAEILAARVPLVRPTATLLPAPDTLTGCGACSVRLPLDESGS